VRAVAIMLAVSDRSDGQGDWLVLVGACPRLRDQPVDCVLATLDGGAFGLGERDFDQHSLPSVFGSE
jgi:hypothetical protein